MTMSQSWLQCSSTKIVPSSILGLLRTSYVVTWYSLYFQHLHLFFILKSVPDLLSGTIWPATTFSPSSNGPSIYITTVIKSNGISFYYFPFHIVQSPQPPEGIHVLVCIRALV